MKNSFKAIAAFLLLSFFLQSTGSAQNYTLPADGKDFYVGLILPSYNKVVGGATASFYSASVIISSYTDNVVQINYFDPATGLELEGQTVKISARQCQVVGLSTGTMICPDTMYAPAYKSAHIKAKRPVNVQFFSTGAGSGGSYLAIPTAVLGTKYVVASYFDNPDGDGALSGGFFGPTGIDNAQGCFMIIGAFDGTNVTITPNSRTSTGHTGVHFGKGATGNEVPYSVNLNRGQVYLVRSAGTDNSSDISGSIVVSDKPVAVLGAHENAMLGSTEGRNFEGRDYMIEQMIPVDYWDTTGYVSVPLKDSPPADPASEGIGENYRTYTYDSLGSHVILDESRGAIIMDVGRLSAPPPERFNVISPVDVYSTNGHKFGLMMYDNRHFAGQLTPPFPAPSMMTILPISRWKTSFLWGVPANKFETLQAYFINVICPTADLGSIMASKDGGPIVPLKNLLAQDKKWVTIPNHPELVGVRYKLSAGCYYAKGPRPFMIYNYGFRALDPNFDLGDFDNDDYFFSYALPIGFRVSDGFAHMSFTVDTLCSTWKVCVHDSAFGDPTNGIRSVVLMDDPDSNIYGPPGRQYINTRLDDSLDPGNTREILFSGRDTDVCFKVLVDQPIKDGYAPLLVTDNKGNSKFIELFYKAPFVTLTPDNQDFGGLLLHQDSCTNFIFKNTSKKGGQNFHVSDAKLKLDNGYFKITNTNPGLPVDIAPGDSLVITACFTAKDTNTRRDTILLVTDCFTNPIELQGHGLTPLIWADNHDFGTLLLDSTKCDTVRVKNVGNAPLVLTTQWVLQTLSPNFTFADAAILPKTLQPGQSILLHFCFTAKQLALDSNVQNWGTNLEDPYKHSIKDSSILYGKGVKPGVIWDRSKVDYVVICEDSQVIRMNLINNSPATALVTSVYIDGPNKNDFHIGANQPGYSPLGGFDMKPRDTIWVDVVFKPMNPRDYSPRNATINAATATDTAKFVTLTGKILHAIARVSPSYLDYGYVALNVQTTKNFTLFNDGDAPLLIQSIFPTIAYPRTNVTYLDGSPIIPGDKILPGGNRVFTVTMGLTNYTDTTVILSVLGQTSCVEIQFDTQRIAASIINPLNTGHTYSPTYKDCRFSADSIKATNNGSQPLTLKKLEILATSTLPNPTEFTFTNGTQTLDVNTVYPKGGYSKWYPVIYRPTMVGPASALIKCTWDSLRKDMFGNDTIPKQVFSSDSLFGVGRIERDTLTARQSNGQPYSAIAGNNVDVPIRLLRALPDYAGAYGIAFQVTYRQDILNVDKSNPNVTYGTNANGNVAITPVGKPVVTDDGVGNETMTFTVSSVNPITTLVSDILTIHYQAMIAKDLTSDIKVSNPAFLDQNGKTLCYIYNDTIPGTFNHDYICGDTSLHIYLKGETITRIVQITPNPSIAEAVPVLTYQVRQDNTPLTIEMFNALGEKVRTIERSDSHKKGEFNLPIGVRHMPTGLYVIRITTPSSVVSETFLIQK